MKKTAKLLLASVTVILFTGCSTAGSSTPVAEEPTFVAESFSSKGCIEVSQSLVDSISEGFDTATLTGLAAGFTAGDFKDTRFVAVEFRANGSATTNTAVFATNDKDLGDDQMAGLIFSVDGYAREFSTWGYPPKLGFSIADKGASEAVECLSLPH